MNGTRRVLVKCANPRCWRHFVTAIDARRVCCDLECDLQLAASLARVERRRYCELCDTWLPVSQTTCRACGAPTLKAAAS